MLGAIIDMPLVVYWAVPGVTSLRMTQYEELLVPQVEVATNGPALEPMLFLASTLMLPVRRLPGATVICLLLCEMVEKDSVPDPRVIWLVEKGDGMVPASETTTVTASPGMVQLWDP